MDRYWTNFQLLINYCLISSLLCPAALFCLKIPNKAQMLDVSCLWGEKMLRYTRKQCVWCSGAPHSAWNTEGCRGFPLWEGLTCTSLRKAQPKIHLHHHQFLRLRIEKQNGSPLSLGSGLTLSSWLNPRFKVRWAGELVSTDIPEVTKQESLCGLQCTRHD